MTSNLGDLAYWLNEDIEIGIKATGVGSAVPPGTCVTQTAGTGAWIASTATDTGRVGIVPNLAPINTDSDDSLQVVTGDGAEVYCRLNGACKPGARIGHDDTGKVKSVASGGFGSYVGHDGENLGGLDDSITDGADEDIIRVKMGP